MRGRTRFIASAVVAAAVGGSFVVGHVSATNAEQATAARSFTLRVGDRATVPAIGQRCTVFVEGGAAELFCARPSGGHHQVTFFRDSILVWKEGKPDSPVWSGRP